MAGPASVSQLLVPGEQTTVRLGEKRLAQAAGYKAGVPTSHIEHSLIGKVKQLKLTLQSLIPETLRTSEGFLLA